MAPGGDSLPVSQPQPANPSQPPPAGPRPQAPSPPSKRDLASWWKQFKRNTKKGTQSSSIFGIPLNVSIKYANVAISLTGDDGQRYIYGYVPIIVAKCGVFLKEKATDVEGIFRLSGSAKRINQLQEIFDSPDRYGKGLDWTGYTVHDAANVFRRYLIQLPEPIVPLDFYERFRDPLRLLQAASADVAEGEGDGESPAEKPEKPEKLDKPQYGRDQAVAAYQLLIKELPPLNRQLLLYVLDLMTVFAAKADVNRMTATNLSTIFQPGLLSHPDHNMSPEDYKLSQDVLVFLIENQDNFVFGMSGTAADEQTVKDLQGGFSSQPGISNLRRSASNASGGADSLRRYEAALRRNASVSSKHSKSSGGNTATPTTPSGRSPQLGGVHRSNTVPSKRPSGLSPTVTNKRDTSSRSPSGRLNAPRHSLQASRSPSRTPPRTPSFATPKGSDPSGSRSSLNADAANPTLNPSEPTTAHTESKDTAEGATSQPTATTSKGAATPSKDRKLSTLLGLTSPEDGRQPNRLKKKRRVPDSMNGSAQSSTLSLQAAPEAPASLATSPALQAATGQAESHGDQPSTPTPQQPTHEHDDGAQARQASNANLSAEGNSENRKKGSRSRSRPSSAKSRSSVSDVSDADHSKSDSKDKRRSWRLPRSLNRSRDPTPASVSSNARAEVSHSSFSSAPLSQENTLSTDAHRSNKDLAGTGRASLAQQESDLSSSSQHPSASSPRENSDVEKRGLFDKFKAKVAQVKEGVKDRDSEKERTRSPPQSESGKTSSHYNEKSRRSTSENTEDRASGEGQEQHPPPPLPQAVAESTAASSSDEGPKTAETPGNIIAPGTSEPPPIALTTVPEEAPPSPVATTDTLKTPTVAEVSSAPPPAAAAETPAMTDNVSETTPPKQEATTTTS